LDHLFDKRLALSRFNLEPPISTFPIDPWLKTPAGNGERHVPTGEEMDMKWPSHTGGIFVMANTVASTDAPILNDRKRKIPGSNSVQEKGHV
jgi:hypothetical protein